MCPISSNKWPALLLLLPFAFNGSAMGAGDGGEDVDKTIETYIEEGQYNACVFTALKVYRQTRNAHYLDWAADCFSAMNQPYDAAAFHALYQLDFPKGSRYSKQDRFFVNATCPTDSSRYANCVCRVVHYLPYHGTVGDDAARDAAASCLLDLKNDPDLNDERRLFATRAFDLIGPPSSSAGREAPMDRSSHGDGEAMYSTPPGVATPPARSDTVGEPGLNDLEPGLGPEIAPSGLPDNSPGDYPYIEDYPPPGNEDTYPQEPPGEPPGLPPGDQPSMDYPGEPPLEQLPPVGVPGEQYPEAYPGQYPAMEEPPPGALDDYPSQVPPMDYPQQDDYPPQAPPMDYPEDDGYRYENTPASPLQ